MSDRQDPGFGKFIPGFDFLQNLAKGASQNMPQMPNLANWVAPTLNVEELDKRIGELKAVRFWLEQNSSALAATIQALEVQKMTLATLKGMNFSMGEVADALKLKTPMERSGAAAPQPKEAPAAEPAAAAPASAQSASGKPARHKEESAAQVVDPLQWWGALTQQFQQIAANAMNEVGAAGATMSAPAAKAKPTPAKKAGATRQRSAGARRQGKAAAG